MDSFDWKKSLGGLGIVLILGTIGLFAKSQARPGANSDTKAKSTYTAQKYKENDSADEFDYSAPYKTIKVDISGQIAKPGVYEITEGSRLNDLVKLAGGLKTGADRDAVNLAVKLQDEQKIVILGQNETIGLDEVKALNGSIQPLASGDIQPMSTRRVSPKKSSTDKASTPQTKDAKEVQANSKIEEGYKELQRIRSMTAEERIRYREERRKEETHQSRQNDPYAEYYNRIGVAKSNETTLTPKSHQPQTPSSKVSLNTASAIELEALPGIGPSLAARIIDYRQTQGKFSSIEGLRNVKGIGPTVFRKLAPWLTL